jgi:hypothetical protein
MLGDAQRSRAWVGDVRMKLTRPICAVFTCACGAGAGKHFSTPYLFFWLDGFGLDGKHLTRIRQDICLDRYITANRAENHLKMSLAICM